MDKKSLTNATCVLYDLSKGGEPEIVTTTETVASLKGLFPTFKEIPTNYVFEQQQTFKVDIYGIDDKSL